MIQCRYNNNFGRFRWKDVNRVRQLLNQGMTMINDNPSVDNLRPICVQLFKLLPNEVVDEFHTDLLQ